MHIATHYLTCNSRLSQIRQLLNVHKWWPNYGDVFWDFVTDKVKYMVEYFHLATRLMLTLNNLLSLWWLIFKLYNIITYLFALMGHATNIIWIRVTQHWWFNFRLEFSNLVYHDKPQTSLYIASTTIYAKHLSSD